MHENIFKKIKPYRMQQKLVKITKTKFNIVFLFSFSIVFYIVISVQPPFQPKPIKAAALLEKVILQFQISQSKVLIKQNK